MEKQMMLGNQAIARGLYEAGVKVCAAYPGTPSTEISEFVAKYKEIYAEWSPNEKVAMEVAIGASIAGVRSMAAMKHVGLNVAADPIFSYSYSGVNAGMVVIVADDPGVASSQNEQDTRMIARAAMLPVIQPSDSQEAKDFIKIAYDISEKYDTPVIFRTTTKLSHSQSSVELLPRVEIEDKKYERQLTKYVMMPGTAKIRHIEVEKRLNALEKDGCNIPNLNTIENPDKDVAVITLGIEYQYVKEVFGDDVAILKLGLINPLPKDLIIEFLKNKKRIIIVEELEPVIEEQIQSWGFKTEGKAELTRQGEYSAKLLRNVFKGERLETKESLKNLPVRPPILCPGCPHRSVFSVLKSLKIKAAGDIGCYTLGAVNPLNVIDTTICMGASISVLHGIEKAKGKEFIKDWVAVIGDSTFMHTGINSLMNMVYNGATGTVIILDNSTTGMTGHQDHAATGKTLKGDIVESINIFNLCKAIGVKSVHEVNAFDIVNLAKLIKECNSKDELSVIITKSPCVLLKNVSFPNVCYDIEEKCKKCGACLKIGCPAITKRENGTIAIDITMCNGCELCKMQCKFGAIETRLR